MTIGEKIFFYILEKKLNLRNLNDKKSYNTFLHDFKVAKSMEKQSWLKKEKFDYYKRPHQVIITKYKDMRNSGKLIIPEYVWIDGKKFKVVLSCDKKGVFEGCKLSEVVIFAKSGKNLRYLFANNKNLKNVNLVHFDTRNNARLSLPTYLNLLNACLTFAKYPIELTGIFALFIVLIQSYWPTDHTEKGTYIDVADMFKACKKLEKVEVGYYHYPIYFDTVKFKNMSTMFSGCNNIKELDNHFF